MELATAFTWLRPEILAAELFKNMAHLPLSTSSSGWVPAVGNDCSGLWAKTYHCFGVPGTPTITASRSSQPTNGEFPSGCLIEIFSKRPHAHDRSGYADADATRYG